MPLTEENKMALDIQEQVAKLNIILFMQTYGLGVDEAVDKLISDNKDTIEIGYIIQAGQSLKLDLKNLPR